jgi:putative flavoprotein involved in K+ transport
MENSINHQVIIIGAGPAGLALALYLQKNNVGYLILEQHSTAGSTWDQMPDHLSLISLWHSNCLTEEDLSLSLRTKAHTAKEFAEYLKGFAKKHTLKIKTNTKVLDIKKLNNSFVINTDNEQYTSEIVVDCRGYFNYPFTPTISMSGNTPKMLHFKDYKNCAQFENDKKILVVGKRLSAGQLLREFAATGKHELYLSVRSEVKFSSHPLIYNFFLRNLNIFEGIIKGLKINTKTEIEVPMHYDAKKVVEEQTKVKGDIVKIENKNVYFTDGSVESIDVIIFATGFRPHAVNLKNNFESIETSGLFYLGRNAQRTFTSRFIRGIREDAPILGQLILGRLASMTKDQ